MPPGAHCALTLHDHVHFEFTSNGPGHGPYRMRRPKLCLLLRPYRSATTPAPRARAAACIPRRRAKRPRRPRSATRASRSPLRVQRNLSRAGRSASRRRAPHPGRGRAVQVPLGVRRACARRGRRGMLRGRRRHLAGSAGPRATAPACARARTPPRRRRRAASPRQAAAAITAARARSAAARGARRGPTVVELSHTDADPQDARAVACSKRLASDIEALASSDTTSRGFGAGGAAAFAAAVSPSPPPRSPPAAPAGSAEVSLVRANKRTRFCNTRAACAASTLSVMNWGLATAAPAAPVAAPASALLLRVGDCAAGHAGLDSQLRAAGARRGGQASGSS